MNMNDVNALIAFGKAGQQLIAMRIVSLVAICGVIGMCFYVAWRPSWEGVACVCVLAACFIRANKDESSRVQIEHGGS